MEFCSDSLKIHSNICFLTVDLQVRTYGHGIWESLFLNYFLEDHGIANSQTHIRNL